MVCIHTTRGFGVVCIHCQFDINVNTTMPVSSICPVINDFCLSPKVMSILFFVTYWQEALTCYLLKYWCRFILSRMTIFINPEQHSVDTTWFSSSSICMKRVDTTWLTKVLRMIALEMIVFNYSSRLLSAIHTNIGKLKGLNFTRPSCKWELIFYYQRDFLI